MIAIKKATAGDFKLIAEIGRVSVEESHRNSCSVDDMNEFIYKHYNDDAIRKEVNNEGNIYHIMYVDGHAAGFSKIIFDAKHPNILQKNVAKLDRIYLLKEYFDLKLGFGLLNFNIQLSKENNQTGLWLFTWVDNHRAVNFYRKAGFKIVGSHKFKVTESHYNQHHQMLLDFRDGTKV